MIIIKIVVVFNIVSLLLMIDDVDVDVLLVVTEVCSRIFQLSLLLFFFSSLIELNCNRMMNWYCYWWLRYDDGSTVALLISVILLNTLMMSRMVYILFVTNKKATHDEFDMY